jgi:hypothetical protein
MKNIKEGYTKGPYGGDTSSLRPEFPEAIVLKLPHSILKQEPQGGNYRMGDISESDEQDQEKEKAIANQQFSEKILMIVSKSLTNQKVDGKIGGHKMLVNSVRDLIRDEVRYLKSMMQGKSADEPMMQKIKSSIEQQAKLLKRNSGLEWPFN